jgi:chorismate dehydratase
MQKTKIAAVEYMNTLPFLHGISQNFDTDLITVTSADPASCANLYLNEEVDIALVPIGALRHIGTYSIITDYCIGSDGAVDTVALLSHQPIHDITQISLDLHSRTSVLLIKILCKKYWNISPEFSSYTSGTHTESLLLIGDKVKEKESLFHYKYDLGLAWKNMTKLPMVYAVWIARDPKKKDFINTLNKAFQGAINNLDHIPLNGYRNHQYWKHYMTHTIKYELDEASKKGMDYFIQLCTELKL